MSTVKRRRDQPRRRSAPQADHFDWWTTFANPLLMLRSGGVCEVGGCDLNQTGIERHHRIRRRDGGDRLSNLLALCPTHHHYVTDHPAEAYANGWSIRALDDTDPETVPVRLAPTGHLWTLGDNGTKRLCW